MSYITEQNARINKFQETEMSKGGQKSAKR